MFLFGYVLVNCYLGVLLAINYRIRTLESRCKPNPWALCENIHVFEAFKCPNPIINCKTDAYQLNNN